MKGFKTVIFGVLIALIALFSNAEMQDFFAENLPAVGSVTGVLRVLALGVGFWFVTCTSYRGRFVVCYVY